MIGIDEAGRGAWAGPLVVAGCMFLDSPEFTAELRDSKVLSKKRREYLYGLIVSVARYHIAVIPSKVVDDIGLTASLKKAMLEIAIALPKRNKIIIDGNYNYLVDTEYAHIAQTIIKADATVPEAMAASILAKVTRDKIMQEFDKEYPGYGFARNVGYGTSEHTKALLALGVLEIHRKSYKPIKLLT